MSKPIDFTQLAAPGVRGLSPYQPGKPVTELQRELGLSRIVKLASNENPLGPSPLAQAALQNAAPDLAEYPDGNGHALKQAIAALHGVEMNQVTLGNGSNDILELLARTFLTPEHTAVFSEHAFAVYPLATQAAGGQMRVAKAKHYGHDLDAMLALVDEKTRLVFIANPNNPTGHWLSQQEIAKFLAAVPKTTLVVIDEAYFEYVDEPDYPDATEWLNDYPNVVVTRTFSKIYGLAALRIGYGLSSAPVADLLNRVRQPFNCNAYAQAAAVAALADAEHVQHSRQVNQQGLLQWQQALDDLQLNWLPSVGNFIAFDVDQAEQPVFDALLREGVIMRSIGNYGMPGFIRVTVGSEEQNAFAIAALGRVLKR